MLIAASLLILAAPPATLDIDISQAALQGLLEAMAPIENSATLRLGMGRVRVNLKLTEPKVEVANGKIVITTNYEAWDERGLVRVSGVAYPEMEIVKAPKRPRFQGKMVRSGIELPGGVDLPIESFVPPLNLPAVYANHFRLGEKTVTANTEVTKVIMEKGKVRLRCAVTFE